MASKSTSFEITNTQRILFFFAVGFLIFGIFSVLGASLTPFVLGALIAYIFDPYADQLTKSFDRLERKHTALIFAIALAGLIVLGLAFLVPLVVSQLTDFFSNLPQLVDKMQKTIKALLPQSVSGAIVSAIPSSEELKETIEKSTQAKKSGLAALLSGSLMVLESVMLILITPFVTFYFLKDWAQVKRRARSLLPKNSANEIVGLFKQVNNEIGQYLRGQGFICLIMAIYYSVGFSIVGLSPAIPLGLLTGLLCFIPVIGNTIMFITAMGISFFQFQDYTSLLAIAGLFAFMELFEAGVLQPRINGEKTGLNPIYIILALLTFGKLFGLAGAILAIPLAIAAKAALSYLWDLYKNSKYYEAV